MRLDKYLADCGAGTRKEGKAAIRGGRVQVDGVVVTDPAAKISEESAHVTLDGRPLLYEPFVYLMLNKPKGCVSATDDARYQTVLDFVPDAYAHRNLFPAGRLDLDTEGFVLLTDDGAFAHEILSPKKHVPKRYYVEVDGQLDASDIEAFAQGIFIDGGYQTMPASLTILNAKNAAEVVIREGKYHQIKQMFQKRGKPVRYLKRLSIGALTLDPALLPGEIKKLTKEEINCINGGLHGHFKDTE